MWLENRKALPTGRAFFIEYWQTMNDNVFLQIVNSNFSPHNLVRSPLSLHDSRDTNDYYAIHEPRVTSDEIRATSDEYAFPPALCHAGQVYPERSRTGPGIQFIYLNLSRVTKSAGCLR